ncbi:MAG: 50S ribosomal protein L31e [Methanobacteriota archaeon]
MAEETKEIERIYVIPLTKVKQSRYTNAAPKAIKAVRKFLIRHMKVTEENVWIDDSVNQAIWSRGKYKIPSSIRVRAVKFEDGVVEASIPELGLKTSRRELLKEEREKKEPILRKEEAEKPAEGEISGTEGVKVVPTGEGKVKVKKKKAPKEEKEETAAEKKEKPAAKKKKTMKEKPEKPAAKKKSAKKTEKPASKSKRKPSTSKKEK